MEISRDSLKAYFDTQTRLKLSADRIEQMLPVARRLLGQIHHLRELDLSDTGPLTVFRAQNGR
jgi:hypothetical protein